MPFVNKGAMGDCPAIARPVNVRKESAVCKWSESGGRTDKNVRSRRTRMSAPPVELLAEYNMAEEKPGLHIDTDWKKQAQEEKKKLAEEEAKRRSAGAGGAVAPAGVVPGAATAAPAGAPAAGRQGRGGRREERELPPASIMMVVQSLVTQVL